MSKRKTDYRFEIGAEAIYSDCVCDEDSNDYCRCQEVIGIEINPDLDKLVKEILKEHRLSLTEINNYCVERILVNLKYWKNSNWEFDASPDYYGETLDGVYFEKEDELEDAINKLKQMSSDIEKIKFVLSMEYPDIKFDAVDNCNTLDILELPIGEIENKKIKVPKWSLEAYKDWQGIIGVCLKENNRYRLVDGHHRYLATFDRHYQDGVPMRMIVISFVEGAKQEEKIQNDLEKSVINFLTSHTMAEIKQFKESLE